MLIRNAEARDAEAIASFIVMAEGEVVSRFTGLDDPARAAEALAVFVLSPASNRYSVDNNLVAEIGGMAAASIISFPADRQPELDAPIIESMRRKGHDVKELFFEGDPGSYYLSTAGAAPAHRGKGLGTALIAAAEDKGRRLGFERASLLVSRDKARAKALYLRLGYESAGDVVMAGVGYTRMIKKI